jgi:hypothetical protein
VGTIDNKSDNNAHTNDLATEMLYFKQHVTMEIMLLKADIERRYPAADIYLRSVSPRPELSESAAVQVKDLVAAVARLEAELKTNMANFDRKEYYRKKNLIRQYKKNIQNLVAQQGTMAENFADGKGPGRPGDSQRHGIPKGATMAQLEKASHAKGRKGQLARWQLNMRRGKKKHAS